MCIRDSNISQDINAFLARFLVKNLEPVAEQCDMQVMWECISCPGRMQGPQPDMSKDDSTFPGPEEMTTKAPGKNVHGFEVEQVVYLNDDLDVSSKEKTQSLLTRTCMDKSFGMRGRVCGPSELFEEPCVMVRFKGVLCHTQVSSLSMTDPKRWRREKKEH
eukprot:2502899-Karenia_brevis.AAC.1